MSVTAAAPPRARESVRRAPVRVPVQRAPDLQTARAVTEAKATTFALACRLLPADIRDDVYRLYLVFRTLDDLVDDGDPHADARVDAVLAWARGQAGPQTDEVLALDELTARYPIPRSAVADFCRGMQQDLAHESFASERDLDRYCYRVAGTVGVVMTALLGAEDDEARACAAALGMAMQRTNILRDIDEDRAAGRVYISAEALAGHGAGLEPGRRSGWLAAQIAYADDLYAEGLAGVRTLRDGQLAVRLAAGLYREILREIERRDRDGLPGRAVVSGSRKLTVAARMILTAH